MNYLIIYIDGDAYSTNSEQTAKQFAKYYDTIVINVKRKSVMHKDAYGVWIYTPIEELKDVCLICGMQVAPGVLNCGECEDAEKLT
jgi:hypothetical protein